MEILHISRTFCFLPDLELLIRGAPDEQRLKWIRRHAENLRKALIEDGEDAS